MPSNANSRAVAHVRVRACRKSIRWRFSADIDRVMPDIRGTMKQAIELVCPAGAMPALRAAVDHGADAVYVGLRGPTNARNFPGLNFDANTLPAAIDYAHRRGTKLFVALNTYPSPEQW